MKKRMICLVLTATMIATFMVGCGTKKESVTDTNTKSTEASEDLVDEEETEKSDDVTTESLKTAINNYIKSYDNGSFYMGTFVGDILPDNALMELGTNDDHSVSYYSMKMFGIDGMYQDSSTGTIYYYDSTKSKWYKSKSTEDLKDSLGDTFNQEDIMDELDIFDTAVSTEYIGEKTIGDTSYYVLNVVSAEDNKIVFDEENNDYEIPVENGASIYVTKGGSTTYNGVEYKVDENGNVTADGKDYTPPKGDSVSYDMYVDKDTMKLYAMSYEDETMDGVVYTVISFDEFSIPEEVLSAEEGNYEEYMESLATNMFGNLAEEGTTEEATTEE